ncbi:hypothetical protein AN1568.2 [Aspergillus nidulans FGSC A4]|nr:hypothetical protein AN1568.2 [Aspergillus nidulans FGSC A4]|eukprot:XP_659172.1 hypothetical protein AN1568.2 [Aspergillus nidulans FGSC A4]
MQIKSGYYIGIDVGTGSARACIIDHNGDIVGLASKDIGLWQPEQQHYVRLIHLVGAGDTEPSQEQSTLNIWQCICASVQQALAERAIPSSQVHGIGFDATCSLAVFSKTTNKPVSVTRQGGFSTERNVILWLDHRAVKETELINATGHKVLKYVGGTMSPEMEMPKILWLKNQMPPEVFADCKFYDLVDALTHIATGEETRSYCSLVEGSTTGWQGDFLESIGLGELAADGFARIGGVNGETGQHLSAGERAGRLSARAAKELGLPPGIAVGAGVIDAYAGWIGTVGTKIDGVDVVGNHNRADAFNRLAAVAGTSTCHIAMSSNPVFVPGVWGPYRDTVFRGCWMAEGGQSATGQLLKHVLDTHPASKSAFAVAADRGLDIFSFLDGHLAALAAKQNLPCIAALARHFFFYGDFFGNRSPLADPNMTGSVVGLTADTSIDSLAIHYYGTLEFIALQTRQIVETMNKAGHAITSIFMSGSQCKNRTLVKLIATACNMPVIVPRGRHVEAAVCHGAAMLGVKAANLDAPGKTVDLWDVIEQTSKPGDVCHPTTAEYERALLAAKYQVFLDQCTRQREYREMVDRVAFPNQV